jgi:hypothetical protein
MEMYYQRPAELDANSGPQELPGDPVTLGDLSGEQSGKTTSATQTVSEEEKV